MTISFYSVYTKDLPQICICFMMQTPLFILQAIDERLGMRLCEATPPE